ncbi:MAG TPA: hypothetical protein VG265_14160 [Gaiellaceae bacterium]|nr:hypothetical protein [Gaiellaceae bacterium]
MNSVIDGIEYDAKPDGGIYLNDSPPQKVGDLWWGTRLRWRRQGDRLWRRALVIDLHPLDADRVHEAVRRLANPPLVDRVIAGEL